MTKFWHDENGVLLRATDDGVSAYPGAAGFTTDDPETGNPPTSGKQVLVGGVWTTVVSAADVKAEAERRILAIVPAWKQRNLTAQAVLLTNKIADGGSLTTEEQAAWDAGAAIWAQVAAIRTASDTLEAQSPIPADFTDDRHWPE